VSINKQLISLTIIHQLSRFKQLKAILYSITVSGIQVHVPAYFETIRLQTQIKKIKV